LILRWVWERTFVLEHLAEIAAIDPAGAGWASDEMLTASFFGGSPRRFPKYLPRRMPIMALLLITPGIGVPSHPQPLLSHLAPVFFLDLGAALLCLQTTVFRVISIFLRL
jgi:hypothetical protein